MFIPVWHSQKQERQDNLVKGKENKEFATVEGNSSEKLSKPQNNRK